MTASLRKIADDLMKLAPGERIALAEVLIASVPEFSDPDIEKAWETELDKRLDQYEAGQSEVISSDESFARARRALNETGRASVDRQNAVRLLDA